MHEDLAPILNEWMFVPDEINVRKIRGDDGRLKIQMRVELGLLQMEWDGRPDGKRPHGAESVLDHYEGKARIHELTHSPQDPFVLDEDACTELQQEGMLYYYRYLSLFQLGDYPEAERDTSRNLRLFDFVKKYAATPELAWTFEYYRPYVIMMNTRAKVQTALRKENYRAAREFVRQGLDRIRRFHEEYPDSIDDHRDEVEALEELEGEVRAAELFSDLKPNPQVAWLQAELGEALATENYERAARIRDALTRLRGD